MRRDELAVLGIQLPVLPTIVLGGLPGEPDWALRLEQIGLDVVSSGAARDTSATYAAALASVPHRPVKATGPVPGARIVDCVGEAAQGAYELRADDTVAINAAGDVGDANDVARSVLAKVADDPSAWWVVARDLDAMDPDEALRILRALVEGVRHVRLFLAKQQFD